jgi:hypothetical protein
MCPRLRVLLFLRQNLTIGAGVRWKRIRRANRWFVLLYLGADIMVHFNSTAIRAADYKAATGTLTIWFTSAGQSYDYYGVPPAVWQGLLAAPSKGAYFNLYIRDQYAA